MSAIDGSDVELEAADSGYKTLCNVLSRRLDLTKRPRITSELLNALEESQIPDATQVRKHFTDARTLRLINVFQMAEGVLDIYRLFNERENPAENKPKIATKMAKMFLNEYSDEPTGFSSGTLDAYFSGLMRLGRILQLENYADNRLADFQINTTVGLLRFLVVEPINQSKGGKRFLHALGPLDDVRKAMGHLNVTYKDELTADHAKQVRRNLLKMWVEKGMYEEEGDWMWPDLPNDKGPKVKEMLRGADYNSWNDVKEELEAEWEANNKKEEQAKADDYKGEAKAAGQSESKRSKSKSSKTKKKDADTEADPSAAAANLAAVGGAPARQTRNSKNKCSDPACPGYTFAECDLNLDYIPCDDDKCKAKFHSACGKSVLRRCPAHAKKCIYTSCLVPGDDGITQHKCCGCGYPVHIPCSQANDPSTGKDGDKDLVCHRCTPPVKEVKSDPKDIPQDQGQADMETEEDGAKSQAEEEVKVAGNFEAEVEFGKLAPAVKQALDEVVDKARQDAARERERAEDLQRKLDMPVQDAKTQALLQEMKRTQDELEALKSWKRMQEELSASRPVQADTINLEAQVKQQQEEIARLKAAASNKSAEAAIRRQLEQEIRGQLEKEHAVRQKQAQDAIEAQLHAERQKREEAERTIEQLRREAAAKVKEAQDRQVAQLQAERQKREEAERTIEQLRREAAAKVKEAQDRQADQLEAERKAREAAESELKQLRLQVQSLRDVSLSPQVSRAIAAAQASMKDNRLPDSPGPSTPIPRRSNNNSSSSSMATDDVDPETPSDDSNDDSQSTEDNNSQSSSGQHMDEDAADTKEVKAYKSKEQASLDYFGCGLDKLTPLQNKWVDFYGASDDKRWEAASLAYKKKSYSELSDGVKKQIRKDTTKRDPDDVGQQYYEKKYAELSNEDRKWVDYYSLSVVDKRELIASRDYNRSFAALNRDEKGLVNQQVSDRKRGLMPATPDRPTAGHKRKGAPSGESKDDQEPAEKKQRIISAPPGAKAKPAKPKGKRTTPRAVRELRAANVNLDDSSVFKMGK